MRWLLRNVIRDHVFEAKRKKNPGKTTSRPMFNGKPLPPAATRFLTAGDFTEKLLDEIEKHQEWGNVQLLRVGREGGEQDISELRKQLGLTKNVEILSPEPKVEPPKPKAPEPKLPEPKPAPVKVEPPKPVEVPITPAAVEVDNGKFDPDELLDPEVELPESEYTESELLTHKKDDLLIIHKKIVGGPSTGKNKGELIEEILEAQRGDF